MSYSTRRKGAHDRSDRTSSYIPKSEIDEVEDDELDTDFIDPRRSPTKIKQMALKQAELKFIKLSKNDRLKVFLRSQVNNTNKWIKLYHKSPP